MTLLVFWIQSAIMLFFLRTGLEQNINILRTFMTIFVRNAPCWMRKTLIPACKTFPKYFLLTFLVDSPLVLMQKYLHASSMISMLKKLHGWKRSLPCSWTWCDSSARSKCPQWPASKGVYWNLTNISAVFLLGILELGLPLTWKPLWKVADNLFVPFPI